MLEIIPRIDYGAYKILKIRCICITAEYELTIEGINTPFIIRKNQLWRELPEIEKFLICKRLSNGLLSPEYILSFEAVKDEFTIKKDCIMCSFDEECTIKGRCFIE